MQKITPKQNRRLHQLLTETGQMEYKKDLVKGYSSIKSESSKDLLPNEADALIRHLESYKTSLKPAKPTFKTGSPEADRMRKKIIHYAHNMGWERDGGKADMKRIDDWCLKFGRYHKALNDHNETELAHLVTQFEAVYTTFLKSISNGRK